MEIKKLIRLIPSKENHFAKIDKTIPSEGGIYFIFNKDLELIYIGKAKSIRNRLRDHSSTELNGRLDFEDLEGFTEGNFYKTYLDPKDVAYFSYILIENEKERVIQELILISILKPKYNFLSKSEQLEYYKEKLTRENNDK